MGEVSQELHDAAQIAVRQGLMYLRHKTLKALCRSQLLPVSGTKRVLTDRLMKHYNTCKIQVSYGEKDGHTEVTVRAWYEPISPKKS